MTYLMIAMLMTVPPEIYIETYDLETPTYDEVLQEAIHNCAGVHPEDVDIALLEKLIEVEKEFNVPTEFRGMILAAACQESKYNPSALGDRKFSKSKKKPMAVGLLQMWPFYEKAYNLDRKDPVQSARVWLYHIAKQLPKVKRQCRYKNEYRLWVAAWVTGVRYKKPEGRCNETPKHLRVLKRWHRNIKIKRANGC